MDVSKFTTQISRANVDGKMERGRPRLNLNRLETFLNKARLKVSIFDGRVTEETHARRRDERDLAGAQVVMVHDLCVPQWETSIMEV